ncbi:MAG: hypothetical protein NVSMB6_33060 [Burkholderiaceae bacterium]
MTDPTPGTITEPNHVSPPPTPVQLQAGKTSFGVAEGVLEMEGDHVRLRTVKRVGKGTAEHVEKLAGEPGLAQRLVAEDGVVVLDVHKSQVTATLGKVSFGSILNLHVADKKWRLMLYQMSSGTGIGAIIALPFLISSMVKTGKTGKLWHQALSPRSPSSAALG